MANLPAKLLSVADLLLLNEFDGRQAGYKIPSYRLDEYGYDYLQRVQKLIGTGYLEICAA
ncbi:MAG: hypothetical protein IJT73_00645 [Selenomonadaceae bacterium]|nr:hypothetical protein [Selenomonadaceae bacterium]